MCLKGKEEREGGGKGKMKEGIDGENKRRKEVRRQVRKGEREGGEKGEMMEGGEKVDNERK